MGFSDVLTTLWKVFLKFQLLTAYVKWLRNCLLYRVSLSQALAFLKPTMSNTILGGKRGKREICNSVPVFADFMYL